jgi:CheY-like chemotaxis protein
MKEMDFCEEFVIYNNGQEALDGIVKITKSGEKLPAIILLDLNMPIMNGWEFLDEFIKMPTNNTKPTSIYIISSSVDPRDLEKVKSYEKVSNYILKPITPKDLETILQTIST